MVPKKKIDEILDGYDPNDITIATLCSHSSLQIFHGARKMGFKTLGITITHDTRVDLREGAHDAGMVGT